MGKPSANEDKEVKIAVESCYGSVSTRLVFTSKSMLPVTRKDVLYLPLRKPLSCMNTSASVIISTRGEHFNDYGIASSNTFLNGLDND